MDIDIEYFKTTFSSAQSPDIPMYKRLYEYFKHQIKLGVINPGEKLVGEIELTQFLKISRTTVRLAFDALEEDGLIIRKRAKGSFVKEPPLDRPFGYLYNFSENIKSIGMSPSSRVLECKVIEAPDKVCEKLGLTLSDNKVFFLERLRLANNKPILKEATYIPHGLCRGIENIDFCSNSLYDTLQNKFELKIYKAQESIEAVIMTPKLCDGLDCTKGEAGYKIERIGFLESGYPFEYTCSITDAKKCIFRLEMYADKNKNSSKEFERKLILK